MQALFDLLNEHVMRGPCQCGQCIDAACQLLQPLAPASHSADVMFFKVSIKGELKRETFVEAAKAAIPEVFDRKPHSYIEIGGIVGDQGAALMIMGMGAILNVWELITPRTILGESSTITEDYMMSMAGSGAVMIVYLGEPN